MIILSYIIFHINMLLSLLWMAPHREGKLGEERLPLVKC